MVSVTRELDTIGARLTFCARVAVDDVKFVGILHDAAQIKQLDADAARASKTSEGRQRVTERIAASSTSSPPSLPISGAASSASAERRSRWLSLRS